MGHSGHLNQGCSLYPDQNHISSRPTRTAVCIQDSQSAWSTSNHHFRRGSLFTSAFWSRLHQALGTALKYSTAYHPQTDGQTERVNQILEDMPRACALAQGPKWEDCLSYAEFSYNNSFQTSLKMSPYEALYGRKCRTPLNWSQTEDSRIFGTDLMMEAEKQVKEI